ncbi:MAG: 30S ribosomal protein S6 [Christensenellales bacterium]|jgi:small subunit ribosomal protein S6
MNKYETMFILKAAMTDEDIAASIEKFTNLITGSATLDSSKVWGRRRLAYPIQDANDGYYVLMHFTSDPDFPAELERNFKIDENVVRYIVLRVEE